MLSTTAFVPLLDAVVKLRFESYSTQRLRELIDDSGLSLVKVAEDAGIPLPTLKKWVLGQRTPTLEGLSKLGKFFGVYFFAEWDEEQQQKSPETK
ncbi:MAG: helix-turn-helix transcriptional regulator [Candidatus Sericytochromatia bacterium]|nr:helix-turn-helix transcriptional regulator [Candidatus Sericytochromatia bacterium]